MKQRIAFILWVLAMSTLAYAYVTTPNMNLKIPQTGDVDYPASISDSFTLIDSHDHSAGKGVQIPSGGLAANSVIVGKIALSATDNSTLEVDAGALRVKDAGITAPKLAANSVTAGKIDATATDNATIEVNAGVLKLKEIPDGSVTNAKRAPVNYVTANCGTPLDGQLQFITNATAFTDVTNCTVTINNVTAGRAIALSLLDNGTDASWGSFTHSPNAGISQYCHLAFLRGAAIISNQATFTAAIAMHLPGSSFSTIDFAPAVGANTYKVQMKSSDAGLTCGMNNLKLVAYEL